MKFKSEQDANVYKQKHQLFQRVAELIPGTKYWVLNFNIPCIDLSVMSYNQ